LPSPADTTLEIGALGLVLILAYFSGDYKLVTRVNRDGIYLAIPMVAIVTLTLLFVGDYAYPLVNLAFSRRALTLITLGHIALVGILALGVLQGVRASRLDRGQGPSSLSRTSDQPFEDERPSAE
jgi:hypothetical protein